MVRKRIVIEFKHNFCDAITPYTLNDEFSDNIRMYNVEKLSSFYSLLCYAIRVPHTGKREFLNEFRYLQYRVLREVMIIFRFYRVKIKFVFIHKINLRNFGRDRARVKNAASYYKLGAQRKILQ